jgi:hypothetical protein
VSTTVELPDLNVWLALASPGHSYHRQALLEAFCMQPAVSVALSGTQA